jgi:hypothetical protein
LQVLEVKKCEGFDISGAEVWISNIETCLKETWIKRYLPEIIGEVEECFCQLKISDSLKNRKKRTHEIARNQGKEPKKRTKKQPEAQETGPALKKKKFVEIADNSRMLLPDFLKQAQEKLEKELTLENVTIVRHFAEHISSVVQKWTENNKPENTSKKFGAMMLKMKENVKKRNNLESICEDSDEEVKVDRKNSKKENSQKAKKKKEEHQIEQESTQDYASNSSQMETRSKSEPFAKYFSKPQLKKTTDDPAGKKTTNRRKKNDDL